ncbi:P-loop containing protein [Fusarium mundagurra]|uniref:P-loop containing protein n=1 Tax=Fusarium mundagurra TaxID=1567541 RepID=A0A8H6D609_9HYPO|nr:P-loop containing protein [Fusarium mundagurra]
MSSDAHIPNIYIIGPQSTGKTTLVNKLQADLEHRLADTSNDKPQIISEVARTVLAKHKYSAEDIVTSKTRCLELQQLILEAQASSEDEALKTSSWFISDRSGFDPLVYAKRYAAPNAVDLLKELPAWKQVKERMERSLIVVCEAGTPWLMDDGVRLMPGSETEWMQVFHDFCELLDEVGLEYCAVPRTVLDISERAELVWAKWTERRQSLTSGQSDGQ